MACRRDMAVISTEGVVGKLIAVAPDASRVLLINDHNSGMDAFDQRSRARGIVAGAVDGDLMMKYVDRTEDVKPGDTMVTSGMDGIFPRGLLVGQVARVSQEGPGLFLNIDIRPAVEFRKLEHVLILTQKPPELGSRVQGLKLCAPDRIISRSQRSSRWRCKRRFRIGCRSGCLCPTWC